MKITLKLNTYVEMFLILTDFIMRRIKENLNQSIFLYLLQLSIDLTMIFSLLLFLVQSVSSHYIII